MGTCLLAGVVGALALTHPTAGFVGQVSGAHLPFSWRDIKQKSLYLRTGSFFEYGGEGGIRTLDTLPYT
ncbi:hypothetical protein ACQV24_20785, partial [Cronobacter sakazakii]|uniref:hypothetical protein n=1 Tax=Cronobacter sakazakii TaxID=28141 RepID=UPI003D169235